MHKTLELLLIPLLLRLKTGQDQRAIKKIKRDIFRRLFLRRGPSSFSRFQIRAARAAVDGRRENEEEIEYKSKECEKGGYNEERWWWWWWWWWGRWCGSVDVRIRVANVSLLMLFAYMRECIPSILVQANESVAKYALKPPRVLLLHRRLWTFRKARFRQRVTVGSSSSFRGVVLLSGGCRGWRRRF